MAIAETRVLSVREAYDALEAFGREYGRVPLLLLLHVAVPQSFRADLVNLLKQNFLAAEAGSDLAVDADVLLSSLVQPAAAGYYRLDPEMRRHAVALLDTAYRNQAVRRSVEVAQFLRAYADALERQAGLALDPLMSEYLAIQRWVALSFIDPAAAASAFASAVASATESEAGAGAGGGAGAPAVASLRLGGVTSALAIPLAGHAELLAYARGLDALRQGDQDEAQQLLGWSGNQALKIGSVELRPGREILAKWQPAASAAHTPPAAAPAEAPTVATPGPDTAPPQETVKASASTVTPLRIGVPPEYPADRFIDRPEYEQARSLLVNTTPVTATGDAAPLPIIVRILGDRGAGKWTLANRLVHDRSVIATFPDGILWIDEGTNGYPTEALNAYAKSAGVTDLIDRSTPSRLVNKEVFRSLFANRRVLIVIEQRTASDVAPTIFSECGPRCTLLHLTDFERKDSGRLVRLQRFDEHQYDQLLEASNTTWAYAQREAWKQYSRGIPLLMALTAAVLDERGELPELDGETWKTIDALTLEIWRRSDARTRDSLRAVADLKPEVRSLFSSAELIEACGPSVVDILTNLGLADLLADGQTVRIAPPARLGLIRAINTDPSSTSPQVEESQSTSGSAWSANYVFLVYASDDRARAREIDQTLTASGMAVRSLMGSPFGEAVVSRSLNEEISRAAAVLVVVSRSAARSSWIEYVVEMAFNEERDRRERGSWSHAFVMPIVIDDSDVRSWPRLLQQVQAERAIDSPPSQRFVRQVKVAFEAFRSTSGTSAQRIEREFKGEESSRRDYALVIGIDDYRRLGQSVAGASDAAHRVAQWLTSPEGGGIPRRQLLDPTVGDERNTGGMSTSARSLQELIQAITFADPASERPVTPPRRLYVYFCGAAVQGPNGRPVILPEDATSEVSAGFDLWAWTSHASRALFDEVVIWIDAVEAHVPDGRVSLIPPPISPRDSGTEHVFSASHVESGSQAAGQERAFTDALLRGLSGEASSGPITAAHLRGYLLTSMARYTSSKLARSSTSPRIEVPLREMILVDRPRSGRGGTDRGPVLS